MGWSTGSRRRWGESGGNEVWIMRKMQLNDIVMR